METRLDHPHVARAVASSAALLVALQAAVAPLWDADLWWILAAGEDILRARSVPRVNGYSFTAPDAPWVMHEWLLGAVYAALHRALGVPGVALARVAATVAAAGLAWSVASRGARAGTAAACVAVALGVFGGRFESARPMGVVYALALLVAWSAFAPRFTPRHALAAALGTLAWTNAHGSFPLALGILAAGAIEPVPDRPRRALAALGCALLTLVNPYGARVHDLVRRYLAGGAGDPVAVVHARIVEWWPLLRAPLRMHTPVELAGFALVTVIAALALRDARWRGRALLVLALAAMALRHQRHAQLAGLLGATLLAPVVDAWRGPRVEPSPSPSMRAPLALIAAVALAAWGIALSSRPAVRWVDASRDAEDFIRLHAALPPAARLYATLPFAGFAVHLRGAPVFFDTRNDCYPAAVLRDALDLDEGILPADRARRILFARGATHAIAYCEGRAARSFAGWDLRRREGALCLWSAWE